MTKIGMPFASLLEHEEGIILRYRELTEKAVQSNISYFLKLFLNSHKNIIEKLKAYGNSEVDPNLGKVEAPTSIWATKHLETEDEVDLNSLQSVLLFIAKIEEESMGVFDSLMNETKDPDERAYLEKIRDEKAVITTKADRLYHDMIESKIS